jgi:hypothetical protein
MVETWTVPASHLVVGHVFLSRGNALFDKHAYQRGLKTRSIPMSKNDAPPASDLAANVNTTQNATKLHDPPRFLHVFAAKKSHFQLSKPEEITWKTKSDPGITPKLTTTNHKYQRLFLSTADWSVLTH